jgi:hypothetical protein
MSFFTGTKSKTKIWAPEHYDEARDYLSDLMNAGTPDIPIKNIPGMSQAEQTGQNLLNRYINTGSMGADYQAGQDELRKTVAGDYDPATSQAYRGYREASQLEEQDALNAMGRQAQVSGMAKSTPTLNQQGKTRRGYSADRMSYLGQLMDSERNRQLSAAQPLMEADDYASQLDLRKTAAANTYGALPRQIETAQEDAIYNALLQEVMFPYEYNANIASILGGSGSPTMYVSPGGPSDLQKFNQAFSDSATAGAGVGSLLMMSDRRCKENIEPINSALDKVKQLDGKTYNFITQTFKSGGLIAQDIEKVLPEGVIEKDGIKYVRYEAVIALLTNAVKELNEKVERLKYA